MFPVVLVRTTRWSTPDARFTIGRDEPTHFANEYDTTNLEVCQPESVQIPGHPRRCEHRLFRFSAH